MARPLNLLYAGGHPALLRFGLDGPVGTDGEFTSLPVASLFLEGMGVVVLLMAAGNWINAYFDVVEDRINRPDRAIVDRTVKRRVLILAHPTFNLMALGLAGPCTCRIGELNRWAADGPRGVAFLLWMYSARWKAIPLVGNGVVAGLIGLVPLWIGVLWKRLSIAGSVAEPPFGWASAHTGAWHPASPWSGKSPRTHRTSKATSRQAKPPSPFASANRPPAGPASSLLLLIGMAYGTALSTMDLESGAASPPSNGRFRP